MGKEEISEEEKLFGSEYKQELIKLMHPDWNIDFYRDKDNQIKWTLNGEKIN